MGFVHLQTQSAYSLLQSSLRIEDLVQRAADSGMSKIALTDKNVMYGAFHFQQACTVHEIDPIFGLSLHLKGEGHHSSWTFLAKNAKGYDSLVKLSSKQMLHPTEQLEEKEVFPLLQDCVAITSATEHRLATAMLEGDREIIEKLTSYYRENMPDFHIGVGIFHELSDERKATTTVRWCRELGLSYVAVNDVCFLDENDVEVQQTLVAIGEGEQIVDGQGPSKKPGRNLASIEDMQKKFALFPEALENSIKIAERCHFELEIGVRRLPKYPVMQNKSAVEMLTELCYSALQTKQLSENPTYIKRLKYELDVISSMDFVDYFLIVWDFIDYAHKEGIIVGPGRGSAAGSLVSYLLRITDVDPIAYGLLFERFLNPERITMPDIDIDFPDIHRDKMIAYVRQRYGDERVAQIVTFGTFGARQAIRDVCRVYGLSAKESDTFSKLIPHQLGITLTEAKELSRGLQNHLEVRALHKKVFEMALRIEGLPRHSSVHAAGVIISDKPLECYVPVQRGEHANLTQWTGEALEKFGLLKMDFLALRNLTLVERMAISIEKECGKPFDWRNIPMNDTRALSLIAKAETNGIFQFESNGMRQVLTRLKPTDFED
ncbi:MAG: DNA polymerase III subunit alpha, partial [Bacilli bacterium]